MESTDEYKGWAVSSACASSLCLIVMATEHARLY